MSSHLQALLSKSRAEVMKPLQVQMAESEEEELQKELAGAQRVLVEQQFEKRAQCPVLGSNLLATAESEQKN